MRRYGLASLFACVALVACGGGSGPNGDATPGDLPKVEVDFGGDPEVLTDDRETGPCTQKLSFFDETDDSGKSVKSSSVFNMAITFNGERDLKVKVLCGTEPAPNVGVCYEIKNSTLNTCQLTSLMAYSDEDGIAQVKLTNVVQKLEQFQVMVTLCDDDTVEPIYFNVAVTPKGYAPLTVGFAEYKGSYPMLDNAEVRLFKQAANGKPKCADLPLDQVSKTPATVASPTIPINGSYQFLTLPDLATQLKQNYTIIGLARQDQGPTQAWACNDADGQVEYGGQKYVELVLKDIAPRIKGSYDITNTFDLVSGLPKGVADVIYYITDFFQNPTATLMMLFCNLAGQSGTLHDFCGYLFSDPDNPDIDELTGTGDIAFQIINSILIAILESNCPYPDDPTLCGKIWYTGGDISEILTKFQILSTFTFCGEPDENGLIPETCAKAVWHSIRLRWTLGKECPPSDPDCGWQKFSFSNIPGIDDAITGEFEAVVAPAWTLSIKPHKLNLKYGALINFAIEQWILPRIFGDGSDGLPAVNCYGAMIGSLMAGKACLADSDCCSSVGTCAGCCEQFAENLSSQTSGLTKNLIAGACEALITTGQNYLRQTLTNLDATPDNFTLATKEPCAIFDTNKDMKFDAIGKMDAQCIWDTQLVIGSASYAPTGTFYGKAK
jgi:hypothetical protein